MLVLSNLLLYGRVICFRVWKKCVFYTYGSYILR